MNPDRLNASVSRFWDGALVSSECWWVVQALGTLGREFRCLFKILVLGEIIENVLPPWSIRGKGRINIESLCVHLHIILPHRQKVTNSIICLYSRNLIDFLKKNAKLADRLLLMFRKFWGLAYLYIEHWVLFFKSIAWKSNNLNLRKPLKSYIQRS